MRSFFRFAPAVLLTAACSGNGGSGATGGGGSVASTSSTSNNGSSTTSTHGNTGGAGVGHVVYVSGGAVHRVAAVAGAQPEDISAALDAMSPGEDTLASAAADGEHIVFRTTRLGCDYDCLGLLSADLTSFELVSTGGDFIRPRGRAAVGARGEVIVYPDSGASHALDLFKTTFDNGQWSAPEPITHGSTRAYNHDPVIAADGMHVLFDCSDDDEYGGPGTEICEVELDGGGFQVRVGLGDGPPGVTAKALHHPAYAPDGSVVFEGDWDGEKIWRSAGAGVPATVIGAFGDDNSPCVLPDGRVVSLWLGRPGNDASGHEIKAMTAGGESYEMLVTGVDVEDIGLTCSQ